MFKQINPLTGVPLKFGLAGSLLIMLLFLVLFYSEKHPLLIPIVLDFRLLLVPLFVFMSMKEFRDYRNDSVLHFWQGMVIGFVCYAIIGMSSAIFILIFSSIEPGFLSEYIRISTVQLINNKQVVVDAVGEEAFQQSLEKMPFTTQWDLALDYVLKTLLIGVPLTIIISVFLRRQPKQL